MKLAFNGEAHYTDFSDSYDLYVKRSKTGECMSQKEYNRVIRRYCALLAESLEENGVVDLPNEFGMIAAATITRRPQYRGKKFVGYGAMNWEKGHYDGKLKTFGLVFLPKGEKNGCLRSYGFVANRSLFKRMKGKWQSRKCYWSPIEFNSEMI